MFMHRLIGRRKDLYIFTSLKDSVFLCELLSVTIQS